MRKLLLLGLLVGVLFGGVKNYKADISNEELEQMIERGVPVVDVRTPNEWTFLGIIPKSKRIMFFDERGGYDLNGFIKELEKKGIREREEVIIICRSGNRSVHVANMLAEKGYEKVYNVKKGIKGWIRSGKKITKNFY